MQPNFIAIAGLIPMIMGFIYLHPKVMGSAWMKANGFTPESIGDGPKPIWYMVALVLSMILSFRMCMDSNCSGSGSSS